MKSVCSYSISAWSGNSTLAAALCTAVVFFETCYPHQKLEICCQILLIEPQKKPWYTEDRRKATGKKKLKPCGKKRPSFTERRAGKKKRPSFTERRTGKKKRPSFTERRTGKKKRPSFQKKEPVKRSAQALRKEEPVKRSTQALRKEAPAKRKRQKVSEKRNQQKVV